MTKATSGEVERGGAGRGRVGTAAVLAAGRLAASAAGFALTFAIIAGGLLARGHLPTAATVPVLEAAIGDAVQGTAQVTAPRVHLDRGGPHVEVTRIELAASYRAAITGAELVLPLGQILRGSAAIGRLRVERIEATVPDVAAGGGERGGPAFEAILGRLSGGFGRVSLENVSISYGDDGAIALVGASVVALPVEGGYAISASLPFDLAGVRTSAALDVIARPRGTTDIQLTSDGAPVQPLLDLTGIDAVRLDTNFEGQVLLSVDASGTPVGGAFDVRLRPGSGIVGEVPFAFGVNSVTASFDGTSPRFRIKDLDYDIAGNRGHLVGAVGLDRVLTPAELLLDFDVEGDRLHLDLGSFMEGPLDVEHITARGVFDAKARRLGFDELRSTYFGSAISGSLALTFPEGFSGSPRIKSDAVLPGPLTPQEVLAGWPLPLAFEAREWVAENLTSGRITNLTYVSDIPMNAIRPGAPLADDTMRFMFTASNARVRYLPDMPPIEDLKASATVRGNSFEVDARSGQIAGVRLAGGRLDMPRFSPAGATASFESRLVGDVPTILAALEASSLVSFEGTAYEADSFTGTGRFDLSVTWPLIADPQIDDVRVTGQGAFVRAAIDDVLPGIDATEAAGNVSLTPTRLIIRGEGLAASAPAVFEWRQSLTGDMTTDLAVTAELDAAAADMVGLPLREFFDGIVGTQIYSQDLSPGSPLSVIGDLTEAEVDIPALGLSKPRGMKGFFETTAVIPEAPSPGEPSLIELTNLKISAPVFNIEGSGVFTEAGGVVRLELPRFFIEDRADLSLRLVTGEAGIDLGVFGQHADATPVLERVFGSSSGNGKLPGQSEVDIALERVSLRSGIELTDLRAEGRHNGRDFDELTVTADLAADERLSITIDRPLGESIGYVEIESTDFGTLAAGAFGIESITGAPGSIKGTSLASGGFNGRFEMGELIVRDAPTLARLLSVGSLDGLNDLLNGEGIRFDKLEGDVWLRDGQLGLSDAKLVGSALGLSATGVVDLAGGVIDVRGAIAPAYAVNALLGTIPGVGRLFVSREGEGIVAFAYQITGPLDQPTVTVNTLSALTPGILRRIFEPVQGSSEATREFLDAAIAAARQQETAEPSGPEAPQ